MPGWMKLKLESTLPGEISITQMTPPNSRNRRGTKEPCDEGVRGEWKSWLKPQRSENEDHGIQSHHFMANRWGNNGNSGWVDSWESLGLQGDPSSQSSERSVLNIHWKDWCYNWSSITLATWCQELTHWKKDSDAGKDWRQEEKGMTEDEMVGWHHQLSGHEFEQTPDDFGWLWKPGVLQSMRSQRVTHKWVTELNESLTPSIKKVSLKDCCHSNSEFKKKISSVTITSPLYHDLSELFTMACLE